MKLIAFQPDCISKSVVFVCVVFVVFQSSRWKYLQDDGNLQSLKLCFFINKKKAGMNSSWCRYCASFNHSRIECAVFLRCFSSISCWYYRQYFSCITNKLLYFMRPYGLSEWTVYATWWLQTEVTFLYAFVFALAFLCFAWCLLFYW